MNRNAATTSFFSEGKKLPRWAPALSVIAILGLVAAIYGQTWGFEFLHWDDHKYVWKNPRVLKGLDWDSWKWALTALEVSNWHPLTWWSYLLDISLFGPAPGPMHLVNVIFHGLNSLLVGGLLMRFGLAWIPALFGAALFAVHPLHVESVAWIGERKDVLSAFFLLLALLAWDSYVRVGKARQYALALLLFALGLMAKSMLVTVPCLLLILDGWPYGRLRSTGMPWFRDGLLFTRCVEKLPFALLAAACGWLTLLAQKDGGAIRSLDQIDILERLGNAVLSYAAYIGQTLVPTSLHFMYLRTPPDALEIAVSLSLLIGISCLAAKRQGATLAGWLWFLISLLPVIGLVAVGDQARADRYMYIPMLGLILMAADGLPWESWLENPEQKARGRALIAVTCCAILALAIWAHRYAGYWRTTEALFSRALELDPRHSVAHGFLTELYERSGRPLLALKHAEVALSQPLTRTFASSIAVSASNAALSIGNLALARAYLETAIEADPDAATPHFNQGTLAVMTGDMPAARTHLEQAIALKPDYSEAHNNLGKVLLSLGQREKAAEAFAEAFRLDPNNGIAHANLLELRGRDSN